ncbi:protealysin inhibitor emfourin [Aureibaculum luteum]|uniref:protealysin inhibitor emfourin n=1 Tax=Aureibaculum luteum TaxID=1548456 RepID=UPI000E4F4ECE|nr:protealysin inhibitor emfourin [Aureibaculum luteum]
MFYNIHISGGFANIQREYEGKLDIDIQQKENLKKVLNNPNLVNENKNLTDAFVYDVKLNIDGKIYGATFNESTIPQEIVNLVDEIEKSTT